MRKWKKSTKILISKYDKKLYHVTLLGMYMRKTEAKGLVAAENCSSKACYTEKRK